MNKVKIISQDTFILSTDIKILSRKLEEKVNTWKQYNRH